MYELKENVALPCGTQVQIPKVHPIHTAVEIPVSLTEYPHI